MALMLAATETTDVRAVPVTELRARCDVRGGLLDEGHVAALAELEGRWPPLLVWAEHPHVVLDGAHRLAAARRLGHRTVVVCAFHGSADEAFVEAVRRNVEHGLPLTRADRVRAAERLLARHPEWSDRRVSELCALSPHTVARLRTTRVARRLGRDGRLRPTGPGEARKRVEQALLENPRGSLREVARIAGVSPETVRRARRHAGVPGTETSLRWRNDPALVSATDSDELVRWLERTDPGDALHWAERVPLGRIYSLADEARRRASVWEALARSLENRAGGVKPPA